MTKDQEQLKLLAVFHYVVSGLTALCSLFPIFHLVFGLLFILAPENFEGRGEAPPPFIGWFFVIFAATFIIMGLIFASFILAAGRSLAKRKNHTFCLIVAGFECLFMPLGTVLGVFTIIVLMRESVKEMFAENAIT